LGSQLAAQTIDIEHERQKLQDATDTLIDDFYSIAPTGKFEIVQIKGKPALSVGLRIATSAEATSNYLRRMAALSKGSYHCMKINSGKLKRDINLSEDNCE